MKTEIVKFNNTQLFCIQENNQILVAIKPICDALGLDNDRAVKTISEDEILGAERSEQTV